MGEGTAQIKGWGGACHGDLGRLEDGATWGDGEEAT